MFILDCMKPDLEVIVGFVWTAYKILQLGVPIILLVIGTVDLGKAVMAGDEKEIKAATGMLMKRAGAAVAVFILVYIVQLVTGLVGGNDWRSCWPGANPAKSETDNNNGNNDNDESDNKTVGYLYY